MIGARRNPNCLKAKEINEKLAEIIHEIYKLYEIGFEEFWENCNPNEWKRQIKIIEYSLAKESSSLCEAKLRHFHITAKEMLKEFKERKKIIERLECGQINVEDLIKQKNNGEEDDKHEFK